MDYADLKEMLRPQLYDKPNAKVLTEFTLVNTHLGRLKVVKCCQIWSE